MFELGMLVGAFITYLVLKFIFNEENKCEHEFKLHKEGIKVYMSETCKMPTKIYDVYLCDKCLETKKVHR